MTEGVRLGLKPYRCVGVYTVTVEEVCVVYVNVQNLSAFISALIVCYCSPSHKQILTLQKQQMLPFVGLGPYSFVMFQRFFNRFYIIQSLMLLMEFKVYFNVISFPFKMGASSVFCPNHLISFVASFVTPECSDCTVPCKINPPTPPPI
ncbi:hypothetical protein ATANTOWER_011845 [Ataeniobius toweri]|uniref:Uncharacterized protein n=1 Tax=Ataeniobius toweri TaxID=208326 RepID=A0ABU7CJ91_9TELE|nr:hypothetical protein [Ataeniobius toweri]